MFSWPLVCAEVFVSGGYLSNAKQALQVCFSNSLFLPPSLLSRVKSLKAHLLAITGYRGYQRQLLIAFYAAKFICFCVFLYFLFFSLFSVIFIFCLQAEGVQQWHLISLQVVKISQIRGCFDSEFRLGKENRKYR